MWSSELITEMPVFASSPAGPLVSEFNVGLRFTWFEDRKSLDEQTLARWLDLAVLWGAWTDADLQAATDGLRAGLGQACSMAAQIAIPHEAFQLLRPRLASAAPAEMAPFLGAAMPWLGKEPGRQSVASRRRLYGPLWGWHFASPGAHGRDFARQARQHLIDQGHWTLGEREMRYADTPEAGGDATTFCGLVDLNGNTAGACRDFIAGIQLLNESILTAKPEGAGVIRAVFRRLEELWAQSLHVRALGAYLVELAPQCGAAKAMTRTCAITVSKGAGQTTVLSR